jgi:hypothetical protein
MTADEKILDFFICFFNQNKKAAATKNKVIFIVFTFFYRS